MRKLAAGILTAGVAVGLMGVAPASAQAENTDFCNTVLEIEAVIAREAFDQLDPLLTQLEAGAPADIAPTVQSLAAQTRTALETDSDPSEDPAYVETENQVGEYIFTNCGWQTAEVSMSEYEFTGLPKTFTTGPVAIKITNDGAEFHELAVFRLKNKKDTVKKLLALPQKKAEKKVVDTAHSFAPPGETTYAFIDFKRSGKYGAACFVPVGSTPEAAAAAEEGGEGGGEHGGGGADGPPHFVEGMYEAFKVTSV